MQQLRPCGGVIGLILLLAGCSDVITHGVVGANALQRAATPSDHYETKRIEGWTVLVNQDLLREQPELADRALQLIGNQLCEIARKVPAAAVTKLRTIRIWLEEKEPHHPCATYHVDAQWLLDHGMNPKKARCVEVANARAFLEWTLDQPWMLLHELSHGYHQQFLPRGHENAQVRALYQTMIKEKRYDSVLRSSGTRERAYAATDPMEYFAESTEAYFGTNDFYPFVRAELKEFDPEMFDLLAKTWAGG